MAGKFSGSLVWSVVFAVSLAALPVGRGEEAAQEDRKVFVEVCVAEVSASKLRALGVDWATMVSEAARNADGEPVDLMRLLDALSKDDLTRVLYRPRLATMTGRAASLTVGDAVRLDLVPKIVDKDKIQLEYRVELNAASADAAGEADQRPQAARRLVLDSASELSPGKVHCVSETRCRRTTDGGKTEEVSLVVLLRADLKQPSDIRTAARPSPAILKGRHREVPAAAEALPARPVLELPGRLEPPEP